MLKVLLIYLILYLIKFSTTQKSNFNPYSNIENITDYANSNYTNEQLPKDFHNLLENITVTDEEVDKLLFCSALMQIKLEKDSKILENLIEQSKETNSEDKYDKIGSYLVFKCFNSVSLKVARKHFNRGFYIDEINDKKFENYKDYHDFDYSDLKDSEKSEEEIELIYKFYKALEIYNKKKSEIDDKEQKEEFHKKIKPVGVDLLRTVPTYVKAIIFVIVFGILFGGSLYYINSIIKKPKKEKKDKKEKKKKKKTQ